MTNKTTAFSLSMGPVLNFRTMDSEALASDRTRLDRDSFLKFDSKSQISERNEVMRLACEQNEVKIGFFFIFVEI